MGGARGAKRKSRRAQARWSRERTLAVTAPSLPTPRARWAGRGLHARCGRRRYRTLRRAAEREQGRAKRPRGRVPPASASGKSSEKAGRTASSIPPSRMTHEAIAPLAPQGLVVEGETLPLYSGSVHYFRLARSTWAARARGTPRARRLLRRHGTAVEPAREAPRGVRLSVREIRASTSWRSSSLRRRSGLRAPRPARSCGRAELPFGGIPERVARDEGLALARSATGSAARRRGVARAPSAVEPREPRLSRAR